MTYIKENMHEVKKTVWTDDQKLGNHENGFEGWNYEGLNSSQHQSTVQFAVPYSNSNCTLQGDC
jgi:hypothetical protein